MPATTAPMDDWALDDPTGQPIERVREIRDDIAARVRGLVTELDDTRGSRRHPRLLITPARADEPAQLPPR